MVADLAGILLMLGVTATERLFRRLRVPRLFRAALGGILIGGLAPNCPQVLGSGHGALAGLLHAPVALDALALVLMSKALASAVSIGSGFRGGLFYASDHRRAAPIRRGTRPAPARAGGRSLTRIATLPSAP